MGKILARIALVAAICLPVMARAAPIVNNGNFSSSPAPSTSQGYTDFSAGSTAITGWTITQGSVDVIGTYWQAPPLGGNSIDLDGNAVGGIDQSINTVAGQKYDLTFYLSGNPDNGPTVKTVQVGVGSVYQSFQFTIGSNSKTSMGWTPESVLFTATGSTTTISFTSLDLPATNPWGPAIANVAVNVPEPSMGLMLGTGLFGFFGIRRRFAK